MVRLHTMVILSVAGSLLAGCASRSQLDIKDLPPSASGGASEHIIDNGYLAFYSTGDWETSTSSSGYEGENYAYSNPGSGDSVATWNLNIIKSFDVYAKWTSHSNRGSNVKYVVHYLNGNDNLVTDTVTVDQRENGGEWFKLGTYRMSALTGRVTVSDDADGYVIADAILFREVASPTDGTTDDTDDGTTDDTDGDGIPDQWEIDHGLDPNDPSDALNDPDGDGLTNEDEYLFLTDPTTPDTDDDGIPDGFEVSYGLDPTVDDAGLDSDQDGLTNYQEYLAQTDPNDSDSNLSSTSVLLTWETPTQRTDGTELTEEEITQYEISYQKVSSSNEIVVDNESSSFISYGDGGFGSSSSDGYIGNNYFTMPAGSGEISAEWSTYDLTPGVEYELHANWTSHPNRASNATYQYTYINSNGKQTAETVTVDQRESGGSWQQLATFETSDPVVTVRIDNNADGYVIADAIRLSETSTDEKSVVVEQNTHNSYIVKDLTTGGWQFRIQAIDSDGLKSDYSEIKTHQIE
jgi:Bacterial TSP3 repeat